jgi:hypothetical protein
MTLPPWMNAPPAPWQESQSVFPRTVSIRRAKTVAGTNDNIGNVGYSGAEQGTGLAGETILFTGLPASIQLGAAGRTTKGGDLPGDAVSKPIWNILIPASAIAQYSIRDRDIILDDEGYRYEVGSNYWTSLGYQLSAVRMEA